MAPIDQPARYAVASHVDLRSEIGRAGQLSEPTGRTARVSSEVSLPCGAIALAAPDRMLRVTCEILTPASANPLPRVAMAGVRVRRDAVVGIEPLGDPARRLLVPSLDEVAA